MRLQPDQAQARLTVGSAIRNIWHDPWTYLVLRWNWKSAVTSAMIRGMIFFFANLTSGLRAATFALLADVAFRMVVSGFYGSLTQAFRRCEPVWVATLFVMLVLPASSHAIEYAVHSLRGTPQLARSIRISICFTIIATLFNYYAMRRGVLVVGESRRSFGQDLKDMPKIIGGFLVIGPLTLWRLATGRR
ncbi:MAG: hypothetical protein H7039_15235 [Bryobacteraceae bacterium]|nr:hypothetical protein [Bryobacteraceae bacterium]